jgi:hypothetical protein
LARGLEELPPDVVASRADRGVDAVCVDRTLVGVYGGAEAVSLDVGVSLEARLLGCERERWVIGKSILRLADIGARI